MRQAAALRGNAVRLDQARQAFKNSLHGFRLIGGGVDADNGVAAAEEQAFESREKNAAYIISWVIRLSANAQHTVLAHRVSAASDITNLGPGKNQIFVAHDF